MTEEKKVRKRRKTSKKPSVFKEFRFEITAGSLFFLGLFLLLENLAIKETLFQLIVSGFKGITNGFIALLRGTQTLFLRFEGSDIIGFIFIVIAMTMVMHRTRVKLIKRHAELNNCPECGGELRHVHRRPHHRALSTLMHVKIRRYACKQCDFTGIRMKRHGRHG